MKKSVRPLRPCYTLILALFGIVSGHAQTSSVQDVILKGGYSISFRTDDSLQYLYLKKGSQIIAEVASMSKGIPDKSLGYVGADFTEHFVLVHSFGAGNPNLIELIKKTNGKNMLQEGAAWIDADEQKEYLLYSDKDVPEKNDRMTLYNLRTGQRELVAFPDEIFDEPQRLSRIQISELTPNELVIRYDTKGVSRTKRYRR